MRKLSTSNKILIAVIVVLGLVIANNYLYDKGASRVYAGGDDASDKEYIEEEEEEEKIIIPEPPEINYEVSTHRKRFLRELFKDCNIEGDKRDLVEACNYSNAIVRNKAVQIAGKNEGNYNLGQICDIFDYCYNDWNYVNDSKVNQTIEYASNTIENGRNGDCDDFAVLLCSMILSIGGEARINFAYNDESGHAFTEVNIGDGDVDLIRDYISKRYNDVYEGSIWSRKDSQGNRWLNLDWFANHPGGKYFDYTHGTTFYIFQEYCDEFSK